jgi:hypothetical protein
MLKTLYDAIRKDAAPQELTINGRKYTTAGIQPVKSPSPERIEVTTLTGLVDYLKANVDKLELERLFCHVERPSRVSIFSCLEGDFAQRHYYIMAKAQTRTMQFNDFLDGEVFNIWLQAGFVDTPLSVDGELKPTDKGLVLKYVGNVKESSVKNTGDDGVSQELVLKTGITGREGVVMPNPVLLRPYRTFNEVEQPASLFVFRAQPGPKFALIEADNGAWESVAMQNIKEFMQREVPGLHVIA